MAIRVKCVCGVVLQAKDEWSGRAVRCPKCGQGVKIPQSTPPASAASQHVGVFDDELTDLSQSATTSRGSPFASSPQDSPANKNWFSWLFGWLFWKFPSLSSSLKWSEPTGYRIRLRGDIAQRLIIAVARLGRQHRRVSRRAIGRQRKTGSFCRGYRPWGLGGRVGWVGDVQYAAADGRQSKTGETRTSA